MRKIFNITLFFTFIVSSTTGQRTVELVRENLFRVFSSVRAIDFNNSVVVMPVDGGPLMKITESGITFHYPPAPISYPLGKLIVYNSSVYLVLQSSRTASLFSFDGTSFLSTPIPGEIKSSPVVFNGFLYILSEYHGVVQLYRYDGSFVEPIPSANLFSDLFAFYNLYVAGSHLYFSEHVAPYGVTSGFSLMKRYDGVTVTTLPDFEFFSGVSQIIEINATGEAYFIAPLPRSIIARIYYYNGSSVSEIFRSRGHSYVTGVLWRDEFYFRTRGGTTRFPVELLKRVDRGSMVDVTWLPLNSHSLLVFQDRIHTVNSDATETHVLAYDGSRLTTAFSVPRPSVEIGSIFLRGGKMILKFRDLSTIVYEYDGSSLVNITGPIGYNVSEYLGATACNYWWLIYNRYELLHYDLAKERICSGDVFHPVIPQYLRHFSNFTITFSAAARVHTWSDINSDWILNDNCKDPDCLQPQFLLTLADADNKPAWQSKFDKPFKAIIPLEDKSPLKGLLSSTEKELQDLIVMDPDLVEKGISTIDIAYSSKEETLELNATTRDGLTVPLRVSLVNNKEKAIWEKEFTAPFSITISEKITEVGDILKFSVPSSNQDKPEYGAKSIEVNITNPSHGVLNIEVRDKKIIDEGEITVFTLLGQKLMSKRISNATYFQIQLPPHQSGIFLVNIKTKRGIVTNKMIRLK